MRLDSLCYAGLTNLRALSLEGCEELRQVSALASMHKLRTLNLMRCTAITGLHHLSGEPLRLSTGFVLAQYIPNGTHTRQAWSPCCTASRRQRSPGPACQYSFVVQVMKALCSCFLCRL